MNCSHKKRAAFAHLLQLCVILGLFSLVQYMSTYFNTAEKFVTFEPDAIGITASAIQRSEINCNGRPIGYPKRVKSNCDLTAGGDSSSMQCRQLSCDNLLSGKSDLESNASLAEIADIFTENYRFNQPNDSYLSQLNGNETCDEWRELYGFNDVPEISPEEADFPLAFNLLVHVNAHQVARLLRAIYRPHNAYCIHVDAKSAPDFRLAISSLVSCFRNVWIASRLELVNYAGFSRLQADINCMKDHLVSGTSTSNWKYLINSAGQAFPLRTNAELVKILRLYNGANDIEGLFGRQILTQRFISEYVEHDQQAQPVSTGRTNPPPPHNIDIVRGSAYGVFSRDFVRFIIEDEKSRDLLEWSRKTYSPDEHYWATLHHTYTNPHLRTPGGYSGIPNNKTWLAVYVKWASDKTATCHGKYAHYLCIFGVGDLPSLVRRPELFANKFYADYQPLALDCLEAWLRHKEVCPPTFDYNFYSKLPFIRKPL